MKNYSNTSLSLVFFLSFLLGFVGSCFAQTEWNDKQIRKTLKKVKRNTIESIPTDPFLAEAHLLETVTIDGIYEFFLESKGYFVNIDQINTNTGNAFYFENTRCAYSGIDPSIVSLKQHDHLYSGSISATTEVKLFQEIGPVSKAKKYNFTIAESLGGEEILVLNFQRNEENERAYPEGTLLINTTTNQLISSSYVNIYEDILGDVGYPKTVVDLEFKHIDEVAICSEVKVQLNYSDDTNHIIKMTVLDDELIPFDHSKEEFWSFLELSLNPLITYDPKYWENNHFLDTSDFSSITKDFGGIESMKSLFSQYSGRYLDPTEKAKDQLAIEKIDYLKTIGLIN